MTKYIDKTKDKKESNDPNVFEDDHHIIKIWSRGNGIAVKDIASRETNSFHMATSLPLLEKAIERAKELREEKTKPKKKTVFEKVLGIDLEIDEAPLQPEAYDNVEFLKHDKYYGDIFYAWNDEYGGHNGLLYSGEKGDEFDE